jgi:preprotein translocase subunit SecY
MSEEGSTGITIAEKFFGLLLVIIGALAVYYTFEASQALVAFTGFFAFLSIILLVLGILLIIAKPELL